MTPQDRIKEVETAIERHRHTWPGKSDEWLFERLDNELGDKVGEIQRLISQQDMPCPPIPVTPKRRREMTDLEEAREQNELNNQKEAT